MCQFGLNDKRLRRTENYNRSCPLDASAKRSSINQGKTTA